MSSQVETRVNRPVKSALCLPATWPPPQLGGKPWSGVHWVNVGSWVELDAPTYNQQDAPPWWSPLLSKLAVRAFENLRRVYRKLTRHHSCAFTDKAPRRRWWRALPDTEWETWDMYPCWSVCLCITKFLLKPMAESVFIHVEGFWLEIWFAFTLSPMRTPLVRLKEALAQVKWIHDFKLESNWNLNLSQ